MFNCREIYEMAEDTENKGQHLLSTSLCTSLDKQIPRKLHSKHQNCLSANHFFIYGKIKQEQD